MLHCGWYTTKEGASRRGYPTASHALLIARGLNVIVSSRERITQGVFVAAPRDDMQTHDTRSPNVHVGHYLVEEIATFPYPCDDFVLSRHGVVAVGPQGLAYLQLPGLVQVWHVAEFVGTTLAIGSAFIVIACGKTCRLVDSNSLEELKVCSRRIIRSVTELKVCSGRIAGVLTENY